uniref:IgGFc-binding protein N-terminal domain-containing protein n=1 Tax=Biomphalaria glabrata TaxID=6526 RepID=A0A2C9LHV7_BIOGL
MCEVQQITQSLADTVITSSEAVGVLSGNCNAGTKEDNACPNKNFTDYSDILLEMLMPSCVLMPSEMLMPSYGFIPSEMLMPSCASMPSEIAKASCVLMPSEINVNALVCFNTVRNVNSLIEMLMPEEMFGKTFVILSTSSRIRDLQMIAYISPHEASTHITYYTRDGSPQTFLARLGEMQKVTDGTPSNKKQLELVSQVTDGTPSNKKQLELVSRVTDSTPSNKKQLELVSQVTDGTPSNKKQLELLSQMPVQRHSYYLTSTKVIQVTIFQQSSCANELGSPAMSVVIPVELFYPTYLVSVPNNTGNHYLLLVARKEHQHDFKYNNNRIYSTWMIVVGHANWSTGDGKIPPGVYDVNNEQGSTFGCYLYGINKFRTYMQPVGYNTTHINFICNSTVATMKPGDKIDNDCDESVDEEEKDGIDNDQDSLIDEDLMPIVDGNWGEWSPWICPRLCDNDTFLEHTRECNNPAPRHGGKECDGLKVDMHPNTTCKGTDKLCPYECWTGTFGIGCEGDCRNCEDECEKINGSCQQCKLGFSGHERGCTQ